MTDEKLVLIDYANEKGRDLIVPDLHGSRDVLFMKLDQAKFDPSCDRVWCLGDLIDRGPQSFEVLQLLKEPWFKAIRGNHEDLLLSFQNLHDSIYHSAESFIFNGGKWVYYLTDEQKQELHDELLPLVQSLPYIRTIVNSQNQIQFHMVHAEMMFSVGTDDDDIAEGYEREFFNDLEIIALAGGDLGVLSEKDANVVKRFKATSAWGRRTIRQLRQDLERQGKINSSNVAGKPFPIASGDKEILQVSQDPYAIGLSPTFVGHTIFMDRCGYLTNKKDAYGLVVVDAQEALSWLQVNVPRDASTLIDANIPAERTKLELPSVPRFSFNRKRPAST